MKGICSHCGGPASFCDECGEPFGVHEVIRHTESGEHVHIDFMRPRICNNTEPYFGATAIPEHDAEAHFIAVRGYWKKP